MTGRKLAPLQIEEIQLLPGEEWQDAPESWRFVRVKSGAGYWLGAGPVRALSAGDVFVAGPGAEGVLRASQIGELRLHAFCFVPDLLWGMFTLAERNFFESNALRDRHAQFRIFAANDSFSARFVAAIDERATRAPLLIRLQLLSLVFETFADALAQFQPPTRGTSASERFKQLIHRLSDADLPNHTPEELARICGCSARHFNRLFREQFGDSVRSRQTAVRLMKAKSLLASGDEKIIDVAHSCGYRNLSLFNTLFKKNFKMTPSEWRRKAEKKWIKAVACVGILWALAAQGQSTNAPAMFQVKGYELLGNTLLEEPVTKAIFDEHVGQVTFESIRAALVELQSAYRARGFVTVAVALPQQQLTNGVIKVQVTEGRLSDIRVTNNRYYSSNNVMRNFPGLRTNTILNSLTFQQQLDRANNIPDRQIYPVISPGAEPATTDLELKVKDRLPLHAHLEMNNNSTPFTPELRTDFALQYLNLWQLNHQFGVQYSFSPESYKTGDFPFYEQPLIASYSAFYRLPLFGDRGRAQPETAPLFNFGYDEATKRFVPPPPMGVTEMIVYASRSVSDTGPQIAQQSKTPATVPPAGTLQLIDQVVARTINPNEDIGLRILQPLPDLGGFINSLSVGLDYKNYRVSITQSREFFATLFIPEFGSEGPPFTEFTSPPTVTSRALASEVQYMPFTIGWTGFRKDKTGTTGFDASLIFQPANIFSSSAEFENAVIDSKADGKFVVVTAAITRDQNIWRDWGVQFRASGQWANQPLLPTEQFALGGLSSVRGYREGQLYGDCGWRVQIEPHTPYLNLGLIDAKVPVLVRGFTFFDAGQRFLISNGAVNQPSALLMGVGAGFSGTAGQHCDFRALFGFALEDTPPLPPFNQSDRQFGDLRVAAALGFKF